jgi:hypothetical protein
MLWINRGGFAAMFADLTYLHIYDNEYDDEDVDKDHYEEPWVVDMCGFMTSVMPPLMWKKRRITTNLQVQPPS